MVATFRRTPLGYSKNEVDEYISQLRSELDALRIQTEELNARVTEQNALIERYRDQERHISGALLDAQTRAVEIEQRAQEQYDRTIMRLAEDSKAWEDRIVRNKEKLITLDNMIESFLSGVKAEIGAARADNPENWRNSLDDSDRILLNKSREQMDAQSQEDADEDEDREPEAEPAVTEPEAEPVRGETAQEPEVDSDIHNLYWRLRNLEEGKTPEKPGRRERAASAQEQKDEKGEVYMPGQSEQNRLTEVLSELGILPNRR